MKVYKLTDEHGMTKNNTQWGPGVKHTALGDSMELCSIGWIHFCQDPVLALLMNPIHANFHAPRLWEAEAGGETLIEALKGGAKTLLTARELEVPRITIVQRIAFGILTAKEVCKKHDWIKWADAWLDGSDRSKNSASASAAANTSSTNKIDFIALAHKAMKYT